MLAHLHNHTEHSHLDAINTIDSMIQRCEEINCQAVAVTDHGNVGGHIDLYNIATDIKKIYGIEAYHFDEKYHENKKKNYHLTLWAKNKDGLDNLWAMSTEMYEEAERGGYKKGLLTSNILKKRGKNIIAGSACLGGGIPRSLSSDNEEQALELLNMYREAFDEFYIELHVNSMQEQKEVNMKLVDFARKYNVPMIYAVDSHYLTQDEAEIQQAFMGIGMHKKITDEQKYISTPDYYLMDEDDIRGRLRYLGQDVVNECFANVESIVESIEYIELDTSRKIPTPRGIDNPDKTLVDLCREGLARKVFKGDFESSKHKFPEYMERINYELGVIIEHGLSSYFLVVSDYTKWAKKTILVGAGRGSAGGSLVCYVTDITEVDPIQNNLYFERFLNAGRLKDTYRIVFTDGEKSFPSNDIINNKPVTELEVGDKTEYGEVLSIQVSRGKLPDVDLDFGDIYRQEVEEYLKEQYGEDKIAGIGTVNKYGVKQAIKDACSWYAISFQESNQFTKKLDSFDSVGEVMNCSSPDISSFVNKYPDVFKLANRIFGITRQASKHAAGVIISPVSLYGELPLKIRDGKVSSQFDMSAVESLGFLKVDILGLRNLTTLTEFARLINKEPFFFYDLTDESEGMDKAFDCISSGDTIGIFQLESAGLTEVSRRMKPRNSRDISDAIALYRPGVLDAGMLERYLQRREGREPVEYVHPLMEPILKDTYGILVYQEQVMELCVELAGYSLAEADAMRGAISKKDNDKMMKERDKFYNGCVKNGIPSEAANAIADNIIAFANYAFPRAHSFAYGLITKWCAWAKANYPVEYMTALMNTHQEGVPRYIEWCRNNDIKVMPPNVNHPSESFSINDGKIYYGLMGIAYIGEAGYQEIIKHSPYTSIEDFLDRVPTKVNKRMLESLTKSGALDTFIGRNDMLKLLSQMNTKNGKRVYTVERGETDANYQKRAYEEEVLGISISSSAFDVDIPAVKSMKPLAIDNGDMGIVFARADVIKQHKTKSHKDMAFLDLVSNFGENISASIMPNYWPSAKQLVREGGVAFFHLKRADYNDKASYIVEGIAPVRENT